jgi:hypothetical protein
LGDIEFYGLAEDVLSESAKRFGGSTVKKVYGNCIAKLGGFSANKVVDFACGKMFTVMIMKGEEKQPPSFVPNKPVAEGLIHFYKKGADWQFITEEEYA